MNGLDSDFFREGLTLSTYHLEQGCRNFMDLARLLALDLDCDPHQLRPYLRAWFNGARDAMEDAGYDLAGASSADEVAPAMKCWSMWALSSNNNQQ